MILALLAGIGLVGSVATVTSGQAGSDPPELRISPQGIILDALDPSVRVSPQGLFRMRLTPLGVDSHDLEFALRVVAPDGTVHSIPRVRGNGFFVTDLGRIVAVESFDTNAVNALLSRTSAITRCKHEHLVTSTNPRTCNLRSRRRRTAADRWILMNCNRISHSVFTVCREIVALATHIMIHPLHCYWQSLLLRYDGKPFNPILFVKGTALFQRARET